MTPWCAFCGQPLERGQALVVTERKTGETRAICRYQVRPRCFFSVGTGDGTTIAMLDPDAARKWDAAEASR